jgi:hypothetical protein
MRSTICKALSRVAVLGAAAATFLVVVPAAPAAQTGHSCPSFSKGGLTYHLFISNDLTCASAKTWALKLSGDVVTVDPKVQNVTLSNGPSGYKCFARARTKGHASAGLCYKGSLAFPKSEITWLGS